MILMITLKSHRCVASVLTASWWSRSDLKAAVYVIFIRLLGGEKEKLAQGAASSHHEAACMGVRLFHRIKSNIYKYFFLKLPLVFPAECNLRPCWFFSCRDSFVYSHRMWFKLVKGPKTFWDQTWLQTWNLVFFFLFSGAASMINFCLRSRSENVN